MAAGYDISASASSSASSATGAKQFGSATNFVVGGSNGFSTTAVLAIVAALAIAYFVFFRKK